MNLGVLVQSTRAAKSFSDLKYASLLDQIGFCWHADGFRHKKKFDALLKIIDDNGFVGDELNDLSFDAKVLHRPLSTENEDEKEYQQVGLGRKLYEIRQGLIFNEKHYHDALRKRGFKFDDFVAASNKDSLLLSVDDANKGKDKVSLLDVAKTTRRRDRIQFQKIYQALVKYKEIYEHLAIPTNYVIPADESDKDFSLWEDHSELAGLRLGRICSRIRCGTSYGDLSFTILLDKIGFVWSLREHNKRERERERERENEKKEILVNK